MVGRAGLATVGTSYGMMVAAMVIWSAGNHMMMPVNNTIAPSLAARNRRAARMGQIGSVGMAAMILGSGLVWLSYGFAHRLPLAHPVHLVYVCYALDHILFAAGIARATYLDKIAENEADTHASLSVGVSIDDAVSMSVPALAGMVWMVYGFPYLFLAAAAIALGNLVAASFVQVPRHAAEAAPMPASDVTGPD